MSTILRNFFYLPRTRFWVNHPVFLLMMLIGNVWHVVCWKGAFAYVVGLLIFIM